MIDFISEIKWRGMVHNIMPGVENELNKGMTTAYIGFDPTEDSLHIGSLVQIMMLLHLQRSGHKPYILIGGATGMVGDPSGKSQERNLLSDDILQHNLKGVKKQLQHFLNFDTGTNKAEIVNNNDWFKNMGFLEFIRDVGKHITVNYMMAKESVKNRLEEGLSFTEFSYQLVQGYDFWWLYTFKNCKIQMGGSDQWGNIITGTELIRRKSNGEAFGLTTPLLKKADGTKFGKTEGGNIWLDRERTSPYKFYQYWLNTADSDASDYIRIFTVLSKKEIEVLEKEHNEAPHLRILQKKLAHNITLRVHSEEDIKIVEKASSILFGQSTTEDLKMLDEKTLLDIFETIPQTTISKNSLDCSIIDFISTATNQLIFSSKGEARRMLNGGGVSINKKKITKNFNENLEVELLQEKYILVQKGKKNYYLVIIK